MPASEKYSIEELERAMLRSMNKGYKPDSRWFAIVQYWIDRLDLSEKFLAEQIKARISSKEA